MAVQLLFCVVSIAAINVAFLLAFLIRTGADIPPDSIAPYKEGFAFLTFTYILALTFTGVFRKRFRSFWDLLKRIIAGMTIGTLLSLAIVYVFRIHWSRFPSSIFLISFPIGIFLIYQVNYHISKIAGMIKKRVVLIGREKNSDIIGNDRFIEKMHVETIEDLVKCKDVDEIIICEKIHDEKNFGLLIYLLQKLKTDIFFAPNLYRELLSENFNGNDNSRFLATFLGKKTDAEEFLIRTMDIIFSLIVLIVTVPVLLLISVFIKLSSSGPILYTQERAGKDGKVFTLYKFRTMVQEAENSSLEPALENDSRVTGVGKWLRMTRLDELPQLLNVLKGQMSLVGPRPENLYRVGEHKALQGLRLAVRPGITGLAQIRSYYDLHPNHKIKYDYLYIQRRSLLLNLYILAKTIPVVLLKKGW
jgi:lipopolysaccharide/colanic/teichoic acid biosynthesis glycosyltransferase